jgi:hypothetical protein
MESTPKDLNIFFNFRGVMVICQLIELGYMTETAWKEKELLPSSL